MSIIFADFPSGQLGLYGADEASFLNGIYAELATSSGAYVDLRDDPDPNIGSAGKVFQCAFTSISNSTTNGLRFVYPSVQATVGMGFRMWMDNLPTSVNETPLVSFRNASNGVIFAFRVLTTGAVEFRTADSSGGSQLGATSGPVLTANAYNHIEIKSLRDAAAGTIELRVNGVTALALTGLALGANNYAQILFGRRKEVAGPTGYFNAFKDVVFWDGSGSTGNDFQGSVAVRDLYTDADISLNWTPSTGSTGWDLIDETTPNDSDYIQAGDPAPAAYVASLTDLPTDVTSVRALLPIYRSVKTDGGDCNLQLGLTPNNTDWDDGADTPLTTAYTYRWDVSELSPDTGVAWTPVEVNAAYVRVNRTL